MIKALIDGQKLAGKTLEGGDEAYPGIRAFGREIMRRKFIFGVIETENAGSVRVDQCIIQCIAL